MVDKRLIPCLLISNGGLVKTVRFENPKYVGDPINAIRIFNEKAVDELVLLDIDASKRGVEPNYAILEKIASECFMPLAYGGGIKNLHQARRIFELGVEKIVVQSQALSDISFIQDLSTEFGSQSIIFSLDIKKGFIGGFKPFFTAKGKYFHGPWEKLVVDAVNAGAGEVLINCINRDGTMSGVEEKVISTAAKLTGAPVIYCGGVASLNDVSSAFMCGADAVAVGSFVVFHGPHRAVLITYPARADLNKITRKVLS